MATNKAWQAVVNPNNFASIAQMENSSAPVKKETEGVKASSLKMKIVLPKRYSVDDNGGGYEGL